MRKSVNDLKIYRIVLAASIGVCFLVTRLLFLTQLPFGLHIDEAGTAYDGWCLANYGVDRYLKSFPVYFINYKSGQNALYTYLCAMCIKLMGYNVWAVRLPAVFSNLLALVFGMLTVKRIFPKEERYFWGTGILMTICPYYILASRFGLESNLVLGFSTVFLYFFLSAVEDGKVWQYLVAGTLGGVLLYTYALTYIFVPIFLCLAFVYCIWTGRFRFTNWLLMAIPWGILASPLIAVQIINFFDLPEAKWGIFTITKLDYYRVSEIGRFSLESFLAVIKSVFLGDDLVYNTAPGYANLYAVSIIFAIIGLVCCLRDSMKSIAKRVYHGNVLMLFWFGAIVFFCCHITEPNVNKVNGTFFAMALFVSMGIGTVVKHCQKLQRAVEAGVLMAYLAFFIGFGVYYFGGQYEAENTPLNYFDVLVTEAVDRIEADAALSAKTTYMAESKVYFAASNLISPYELHIEDEKTYGNYVLGTLPEISKENNYIVRDIYPNYMDELRAMGFAEEAYKGYSLFYAVDEEG